jgi:hypothetical protein
MSGDPPVDWVPKLSPSSHLSAEGRNNGLTRWQWRCYGCYAVAFRGRNHLNNCSEGAPSSVTKEATQFLSSLGAIVREEDRPSFPFNDDLQFGQEVDGGRDSHNNLFTWISVLGAVQFNLKSIDPRPAQWRHWIITFSIEHQRSPRSIDVRLQPKMLQAKIIILERCY